MIWNHLPAVYEVVRKLLTSNLSLKGGKQFSKGNVYGFMVFLCQYLARNTIWSLHFSCRKDSLWQSTEIWSADEIAMFWMNHNIASFHSFLLSLHQCNWQHRSPESKNLPISISVLWLFVKQPVRSAFLPSRGTVIFAVHLSYMPKYLVASTIKN